LVHGLNNSCDIGGQKLHNEEAIVGSQYTSSWMRSFIVLQQHCFVWESLSVSGKSILLDSVFKNIHIHPCFFLDIITDMNAVYFINLEPFLLFSKHYKFHFFSFLAAFPKHMTIRHS
jgi:hypothetical protein